MVNEASSTEPLGEVMGCEVSVVQEASMLLRVATMAAEMAILCVLFVEFSEPDETGINTCLILKNMLNVTVTALVFQNKREHPNQVKGFVETWFLIIVIQQLSRISG